MHRVRYEFGVKVSIVTTLKEGLVFDARSMPGDPYDGHTLHEALERAAILSDAEPKMASSIVVTAVCKSSECRDLAFGVEARCDARAQGHDSTP